MNDMVKGDRIADITEKGKEIRGNAIENNTIRQYGRSRIVAKQLRCPVLCRARGGSLGGQKPSGLSVTEVPPWSNPRIGCAAENLAQIV